jgi:hypothetical protein
LSWLSGYFISQTFNPVLFAFRGPVTAGQMGMTLNLCTAIMNVSIAWMSTKSSPFGGMVAKRQWDLLDSAFFKTFRQSLVVLVCIDVAACACLTVWNHSGSVYAGRFLRPPIFGILLLATLFNHVTFCEAFYLRTHKKEPLLWSAILVALLTLVSTFLLVRPFGAAGVAVGYMICCLAGVIVSTRIFLSKRRLWHSVALMQ